MSGLESFLQEFGGVTEEYKFYKGEVTLRFDKKKHQYFLVADDGPGGLELLWGASTVCHIVDKSDALIPWAVKQMAAKLLKNAPSIDLPDGKKLVVAMPWDDFEKLVLDAKTAHREKLDDASNVGNIAHAWIERYINAELSGNPVETDAVMADMPENERSRNCCAAALDWMTSHNVRWISTERKVYSRKYKYAGTLDGLCWVDSCSNPLCCPNQFKNRLSVADWKTSNSLYIDYVMQTAAYEQAVEEEDGIEVEDRWVLRLGKEDGEFDPWHLPEDDFEKDFQAFMLCLELSRAIDSLRSRMDDRAKVIRDLRKAEQKAAREAQLKIKCQKADKFKGTRYPKCNGGEPCQTCLTKFNEHKAGKK